MNPQSFLTAVCQFSAQKYTWELDKLVTWTDITKRTEESEMEGLARDGAYIMGLFLQGARWDIAAQNLERSKPKKNFMNTLDYVLGGKSPQNPPLME